MGLISTNLPAELLDTIITSQWSRLDDLKVPRLKHRCMVFQEKLIISGGDRPSFYPDSKAFFGATSYRKTGITSRGFYFFDDQFTAASNRGRLLIKGGLYFPTSGLSVQNRIKFT